MSEAITSAPLAKPPRVANRLASKDDLLIAWQSHESITDKDGAEHHFALHSPILGWRAYCLDKQYGKPVTILPASSRTVWMHTDTQKIMRLRIDWNGEAIITAVEKGDWLFHTDENSCLVGKRGLVARGASTIRRLCFDGDGQLVSSADFDAVTAVGYAHFLADGVMVALDFNCLVVLSPDGETVYKNRIQNGSYDCFTPLVLYRDTYNKDYLYYTDAPHQAWHRTGVSKLHKERTGNYGFASFLAVIGEACYIAVEHGENCVSLYRSLPEATENIEYVWGIKFTTNRHNLVCHNGLICINCQSSISGIGSVQIPENDGFLAWNPIGNTFYADIPRLTSIPRLSATRTPVIHIPELWGRAVSYGDSI